MSSEHIETVIVGAGQAGLSISEHLTRFGCPHVLLEQNVIGDSWRNERWDSMLSNGPAWHDRLPSLEFPDVAPDQYATAAQVADYLELYAKKTAAPVRTGVKVLRAQRRVRKKGFRIETSDGVLLTENLVAASGTMRSAKRSNLIPEAQGLLQIHSSEYRNPEQLNPGCTLVIGSGASGTQIAIELMESGRSVFLSLGHNMRPPRTYRTIASARWSSVLGLWDTVADSSERNTTIAQSGSPISHTIDYRKLNKKGMRLVGKTDGFDNGRITFKDTLRESVEYGNRKYLENLRLVDEYITRNGLELPLDRDAWLISPITDDELYPCKALDLRKENILNIIWAHGFNIEYSWMDIDRALRDDGYPIHKYGISPEEGLYFIGLPWQINRSSSFIWGEWNDAALIAQTIWRRRGYFEYRNQG